MAKKVKVDIDVNSKDGVTSINKVTTSFDKMDKKSKQASKNITTSFNKMKASIIAVGATTAAIFVKMSKDIINYGDKLHKMNLRLGISVKELDKLRQIAALSGVEFNVLTMGLQRMTRRIQEASEGTGVASSALEKLGISAEELNKLAPEDQFKVISKELMGISSSSERVAIAFKLFDSAGVSVLQMMKGLNKALESTTSTMDQKTATSFATFNDNMAKIFENLKQSLIPQLGELAEAFNKVYDSATGKKFGLKGQAIKEGFKKFPLLRGQDKSQEEMIQYNKMRESWIEMRYNQLKVTEETNAKIIKSNDNVIAALENKISGLKSKTKTDNVIAPDWYIEQDKIDEIEGMLSSFFSDIESMESNLTDKMRSENKERIQMANDLRDERVKATQEVMEAMLKDVAIAIEEAEKIQQKMEEVAISINESLASGMTDALMDWIEGTKSAKEAFIDFARSFLMQISKMIAQQAILNAMKSIGGGAAGGIGGVIAGLFGADGGVAQGGIDFKPFATGGLVTKPTVGLVGEGSMNEAIVPLPNGRSIPVEMKGGSGGVNIINNVTVEAGAGGSDEDRQNLASQTAIMIEQKVKQIIGTEKRYGGLLYS